jgi:predicted RNase H-like HicB family nuclease
MKFLIAIEPGTDKTAFGVTVPDLPGCFSAGDTLEEAFDNAKEAIDAHLEALAEDGADIPSPKPMASHTSDPEYAGWTWGVVEVDVTRYEGKAEKINITLPGRLLAKIDAYTQSHNTNRSRFLADAARAAMQG